MPILFQPVWLILLFPLAALSFLRPLPNRVLRTLRAAAFVILVMAMCDPALRLPDRSGTVVVVADRSESMPPGAAASETEMIGLLQQSMGPRDLLGVVSFGRNAVVERPPQRGEFGGFNGQVGVDHSDLNQAIEAALTLIPNDAGGRILVLSDGKWTGQDPTAAAARAAGRSVAIDYRPLARPPANDLAIESFQTPESVLPDQSFIVTAWVQSPVRQEIRYSLHRGSVTIASGAKTVPAGLSKLLFRDRAGTTGVNEYLLTIDGAKDDSVPENNQARSLVSVQGPRPILQVSDTGPDSGLGHLLASGGVEVAVKRPGEVKWTLEELAQYSGVILENLPASRIGTSGMETLAAWVEGSGSGLMLTGGQKSYGPGGYFKSPLDRILPVSMELRREHRKLSLAIVVALDRSGSMSMPVGNGKKKIDLADMGTVQVLDLMAPSDEFGVIAVDTQPHVIVDLDAIENNPGAREKILSIDSMGGGIVVVEALASAAQMVVKAKAGTRHIVLFADANDAAQQLDQAQDNAILEHCRADGITVSVIGLGTESDKDAWILKEVAQRGGGDCYFTANPEELPQLFAQDTFTIARSTFIDQPTPLALTAGFSLLGALGAGDPPSLGGYNLCYIRPEANLAAVTQDEFQAPVVASWNVGSGRALCYTGEADGNFAGPFSTWNQAGDFYATLARWTAGFRKPLPEEMLLTQEVRDGVCFVQLHLDPDRAGDPFATLPKLTALHAAPGGTPAKFAESMQWKTADLLEATIPIQGRETVLNTVEVPGQNPVTLPPVCSPYSPEFAPDTPGRGVTTLEKLSAATGGRERIEIPTLWKDLPSLPHYIAITPWVLALGMLVFLIEVLERRTGFVSQVIIRKTSLKQASAIGMEAEAARATPWWKKKTPTARRQVVPTGSSPVSTSAAVPVASAPAKIAGQSDPAAPASSGDAFREARDRAKRRTRNSDSGGAKL